MSNRTSYALVARLLLATTILVEAIITNAPAKATIASSSETSKQSVLEVLGPDQSAQADEPHVELPPMPEADAVLVVGASPDLRLSKPQNLKWSSSKSLTREGGIQAPKV